MLGLGLWLCLPVLRTWSDSLLLMALVPERVNAPLHALAALQVGAASVALMQAALLPATNEVVWTSINVVLLLGLLALAVRFVRKRR